MRATENWQMRLNTLSNSRKTFASLIRRYQKGLIEAEEYRNLVVGMKGFLGYWALEKNIEIEKEIEAIRQHVGLR